MTCQEWLRAVSEASQGAVVFDLMWVGIWIILTYFATKWAKTQPYKDIEDTTGHFFAKAGTWSVVFFSFFVALGMFSDFLRDVHLTFHPVDDSRTHYYCSQWSHQEVVVKKESP